MRANGGYSMEYLLHSQFLRLKKDLSNAYECYVFTLYRVIKNSLY